MLLLYIVDLVNVVRCLTLWWLSKKTEKKGQVLNWTLILDKTHQNEQGIVNSLMLLWWQAKKNLQMFSFVEERRRPGLLGVGFCCSTTAAIWWRKKLLWLREKHQRERFPERKPDKANPNSLPVLLLDGTVFIVSLTPTGSFTGHTHWIRFPEEKLVVSPFCGSHFRIKHTSELALRPTVHT